jgi:hypothetical protein
MFFAEKGTTSKAETPTFGAAFSGVWTLQPATMHVTALSLAAC